MDLASIERGEIYLMEVKASLMRLRKEFLKSILTGSAFIISLSRGGPAFWLARLGWLPK